LRHLDVGAKDKSKARSRQCVRAERAARVRSFLRLLGRTATDNDENEIKGARGMLPLLLHFVLAFGSMAVN
jgi:hypothetical protein